MLTGYLRESCEEALTRHAQRSPRWREGYRNGWCDTMMGHILLVSYDGFGEYAEAYRQGYREFHAAHIPAREGA